MTAKAARFRLITVRRLTLICPNATVTLGPLQLRAASENIDVMALLMDRIGQTDRVTMYFDWLGLSARGLLTAMTIPITEIRFHLETLWPMEKPHRADGFKHYVESIGGESQLQLMG